jgi:hypothetical protein
VARNNSPSCRLQAIAVLVQANAPNFCITEVKAARALGGLGMSLSGMSLISWFESLRQRPIAPSAPYPKFDGSDRRGIWGCDRGPGISEGRRRMTARPAAQQMAERHGMLSPDAYDTLREHGLLAVLVGKSSLFERGHIEELT